MKMILFYKMVNKLAPSYLQKYVIFTESNYMLRTSGKVQIKPIKCRLTSFKKSVYTRQHSNVEQPTK